MALLMADRQWGSTGGRFDYRAEAARVLAGMEASTLGPVSRYPLFGDQVDPGGTEYNQWTTRSSDFTPGHFRRLPPGDRPRRLGRRPDRGAAGHRNPADRLGARHRPAAGFHRAHFCGEPHAAAGRSRFPGRRKRRPLLVQRRPLPLAARQRRAGCRRPHFENPGQAHGDLIRSATGNNPLQIQIGYQLNGTQVESGFSSFYAAPFAVSAMLDPAAQSFLNAGWDAVATRVEGYYEDR